jgi:hypothetical protein
MEGLAFASRSCTGVFDAVRALTLRAFDGFFDDKCDDVEGCPDGARIFTEDDVLVDEGFSKSASF